LLAQWERVEESIGWKQFNRASRDVFESNKKEIQLLDLLTF